MVPDSLHDRWDGSSWRWWAFLAGVMLALLAVVAGLAASLALSGTRSSLVLAALLVELFVIGLAGSGVLTGVTSRVLGSGIARQPLPKVPPPARELADHERARQDRRTLRAGLMTMPVLVAFVTLLFV
jgi:hypothetical protein